MDNKIQEKFLKDYFKQNKIEPKISLGQNFLCDMGVLKKIASRLLEDNKVDVSEEKKFNWLLEVGPGTGNLTEYLFSYTDKLTVVEIDAKMVQLLKKRFMDKETSLEILHQDIRSLLREDDFSNRLANFSGNFAICGNLPYYITTDLIILLTSFFVKASSFLFLIQKDVLQRILATTSTKSYGPLAIYLQEFFEIDVLDEVSPEVFFPRPKIVSQVIRLRFKKNNHSSLDLKKYYDFLKLAFSNRRKQWFSKLVNLSLLEAKANSLFHSKTKLEIEEFWLAYLLDKGYPKTFRIENIRPSDCLDIYKKIYNLN